MTRCPLGVVLLVCLGVLLHANGLSIEMPDPIPKGDWAISDWASSDTDLDDTVIVNTNSGAVQGKTVRGIARFLGIPYATAPVDELRFLAPRAAQPWSGILEALDAPPACVQSSHRSLLSRFESEDCLYLNVWAPEDAVREGNLPVMVWIHGGSYQSGSGSIYLPSNMIERGGNNAIVVTINYRLGVFGYVSLADSPEGDLNAGLLDQQLALSWVRENIEAFGGDAQRVMVFGESAGGGSIAFQLCMQSSRGLFDAAILESPGPWAYRDTEEGAHYSHEFAASLGCSGATFEEVMPCLQALPFEAVKEQSGFGLYPVVGFGDMPDQPARMMSMGKMADVPTIVGVNALEGNFFVIGSVGPPPLSDSDYFMWVTRVASDNADLERFMLDLYEPVRQTAGNWHALSQMTGDLYITCGAQLALNATLHIESDVYSYVFTQKSPYAIFNITHVSEIPYVFARYQRFTEDDEMTVDKVAAWWVNMAIGGSPNGPVGDAPHWPRYDPTASSPTVMDIRGRTGQFPLLFPYERNFCEQWSLSFYPTLPPQTLW